MVRVSALFGAVVLATAVSAAARPKATVTTTCSSPSPTVDLGYGVWSGKINVSLLLSIDNFLGVCQAQFLDLRHLWPRGWGFSGCAEL